ARKWSELDLRAVFRHRVASAQGRSPREGAPADSRRSIRTRPRARRTETAFRRRRLLPLLLRAPAADRAGDVSPHPRSRPGKTGGVQGRGFLRRTAKHHYRARISSAPDRDRPEPHPGTDPRKKNQQAPPEIRRAVGGK